MHEPAAPDITVMLHAMREGDASAAEAVSAAVYGQLRELARRRLASEREDHTLQPTALVHEAYLRLLGSSTDWRNRLHFFATAALHMRSILVDHARARQASKRGGDLLRVTLSDAVLDPSTDAADGLLALDQALRQLEGADPRTARVIELTYFGGLTRDEIADLLDISTPTVDRALRFGRAWLKHAIEP